VPAILLYNQGMQLKVGDLVRHRDEPRTIWRIAKFRFLPDRRRTVAYIAYNRHTQHIARVDDLRLIHRPV